MSTLWTLKKYCILILTQQVDEKEEGMDRAGETGYSETETRDQEDSCRHERVVQCFREKE